jgi:hypothetical protein
MKKLLLFVLFSFIGILNAQKIDFKNDKIKLDNTEILTYKFFDTKRELALYKLNTTEELIYVIYRENETPGYFNDDYYSINFPSLKLKMETSKWDSWKKTLKWFLENGLFDNSGNLNSEKVQNFIDKYNEPISMQKIR